MAQDPPVPLCNIPSIRFGAGFLARTFARLVKDLVDISTDLVSGKAIQVCICDDDYDDDYDDGVCVCVRMCVCGLAALCGGGGGGTGGVVEV